MDLFSKLGSELRDLFKDLFRLEKRAVIESKMDDILKTASLMDQKIIQEVKELQIDVEHYLKYPENKKYLEILKRHAIKLEQETRNM